MLSLHDALPILNLAVKGTFWSRAPRRRILTTRAEHHATLDAVEWLERHEGAIVDWIDVDAVGRLSLASLEASLDRDPDDVALRSEEHTSELQSLMRISYAVFCLKKKTKP